MQVVTTSLRPLVATCPVHHSDCTIPTPPRALPQPSPCSPKPSRTFSRPHRRTRRSIQPLHSLLHDAKAPTRRCLYPVYSEVAHMASTSISRKRAEMILTRLSHQNNKQSIVYRPSWRTSLRAILQWRMRWTQYTLMFECEYRNSVLHACIKRPFCMFFRQTPRPAHSLIWDIWPRC